MEESIEDYEGSIYLKFWWFVS